MAVSPYLKSLAKVTPPRVDDNRINDIIGSATAPDVFEASQNLASEMMTNQLMLHDNGKVFSAAENEMFSTVISNTWGIDKDLVKADLPGFIERYTGIKVGNNWLQELGEYASTWADNKKLSFYQFKMNFLDPESDAYKKYEQLSDNISMNIQKKQKTFKDFGKFGTSVLEAAPTTVQLLEQLGIMVATAGAGALAGSAMGAGALVTSGGTLGAGVGSMLAGSTAVATMAGATTGTLVGHQLNLLHMDIIEAGGKAHEMRQMFNEDGTPMFTNAQIAAASTVYAAGIHLIEGYTDSLVDPIVKGMGINKLSKPLKNLFDKNFATRLLGYAWDTIGQSAQEGFEGLWSSVVTDTTKDLIDILHRDNVNFDEERVKREFKEAGKSAWEDFSQSIVGFGVGGIPSALLANMAGVNRMYFNPTQVNAQMRSDANTYFDGGQPINIMALDTQGESWSREMEESMKDHKHHAIPVIINKETGLLTPISASDRAYVATLRESGATGASVIYVNRESGNENLAQYYASVIDEALVDTEVEMDEDYTPDISLTENDENEINTSESGIIYGTSGNTILVNGSENISKVEQFFKDNERTSAIIHNEDGSVSIAVKENGRNTMLKIKALEESDTVKPEKVTPVQSYREWATLETERRVESDPFNTSNYLRNYEEKMAFDEIDKALPENDKMTFEEKRALQFSKLGAARIMPIVSEVTGINTSDLLKKFTFTFDTGRLGDMAYGGIEESNGQYKIIINKTVRPDTIMHEIIHGLRRLATSEQLSGFATAYNGTEGAMWVEDIKKVDGKYQVGDKTFDTYSEAFDSVRDNEERFVDDFMRYLYGEEGFTDSQKSFFAQVKEFFENFWDRMRELLAPKLSAETVRAFDILFGKDTPVQERADFIEVAATEGFRTAVDLANTGLEDIVERDMDNGLDEEGNTLYQKLAPNGKPSNLTDAQWEMVRTPEFKAWFGDWENDPQNASKIIDENGEPKVVYHGSMETFDVFDASKSRANMDIQGNFFSPWELDAKGYGTNVRAFFLNIRKPANWSTGYKALNDFKGQNYAGTKAREQLIAAGYDGVNNEDEEYIAFNSTQIKSATDNSGAFSRDNDSILYQRIMDRNTQARIDADYEATENTLRADSSNFDSEGNHLAPNGKKSNLTYKQWVQVRTPAFMDWFGDWISDPENASKVVDENGEPLIIYHGTVSGGFDVFDLSRDTGRNDLGRGFYFTDSFKEAEKGYASFDSAESSRKRNSLSKSDVMPVFLNMRNPFFVETVDGTELSFEYLDGKPQGELVDFALAARKQLAERIGEEGIENLDGIEPDYLGILWTAEEMYGKESLSASELYKSLQEYEMYGIDRSVFFDALYEIGYDGIIDSSIQDKFNRIGLEGAERHFVVQSPNQIKSATDNSGAFSTENDSILYQTNTDSENFKNWFKDSRVVDENGNPLRVYHGTPSPGFSEFSSENRINAGEGGLFYFTDNTDIASQFSAEFTEGSSAFRNRPTGNYGGVYPVYLSMQNPLDFRSLTEEQIKLIAKEGEGRYGGDSDYIENNIREAIKYNNDQLAKFYAIPVLEKLTQFGYDGMIARMGTGHYEGAIEYAVPNSNQIKSVFNSGEFSTENDSILYQTNDGSAIQNINGTLVVTHNLSSANLKGIDEIGGMPMPSLAVTKPDVKIDSFGEITLVGDKDLAETLMRNGEIYDRDIWSPTVPRPEYKVDKKGLEKFDSWISKLPYKGVIGVVTTEALSKYQKDSPDALASFYASEDGVRLDYCKDHGIDIEIPKTPKVYSFDEKLLKAAKKWGEEKGLNYLEFGQTKEFYTALEPTLEEVISDKTKKYSEKLNNATSDSLTAIQKMLNKNLRDRISPNNFASMSNLFDSARNYKEGEMVVDKVKLRTILDEKAPIEEVKQWILDTKIEGIFSNPVITVKKKKVPYNAQNIFEYMVEAKYIGNEDNALGYPNSLAASLGSRALTSRQEIALKERFLSNTKFDEYQNMFDSFHTAAQEAYKYNDSWDALDSSNRAIADYLKSDNRTTTNLKRQLTRYGFNITEELLKEAKDLVSTIEEMPRRYFEAKPRRIMNLSDFKYAIVPTETKPETIEILNNSGLQIVVSDNRTQALSDITKKDTGILFQLSDEERKKALESRKRDIETATAGGYWIRTEYIEEFAGEDWADRELKVRHWMQDSPDDYKDVKEIARRVGDYQEFKEELHKKYEDNWFDEDESFYKRIYQLAQTRTAQEKDSEFIARNVMGDDNLLRTAKALKGYADLDFVPKPGRRSGGYYKIIGQLNRAKGVSNKVRSLSDGERGKERSTSEEIQAARDLILKNPRAYRMAYEKAMLGENRASIIRGMEDKRFEVGSVRQESNDLTMDYDLDTLDDRLEAELYSMEEEQLQAERKANLNKAKQTDWKKTAAQLEKKLAQANADLEKLNTEKLSRQQAQKERDIAISERNELRKQMTELQNELSETKAERSEFKAQRDERRKRVAELRKQLVEANRKVRTLSRILDAYERREAARNAKEVRDTMIAKIRKTVRIGKTTFSWHKDALDASYADAFAFINGIFAKVDRSDLYAKRKELEDLIDEMIEQQRDPKEIDAIDDELENIKEQIRGSEMRKVPEVLVPYLGSLQKADNRHSKWTLEELSNLLTVAQTIRQLAKDAFAPRFNAVQTERNNTVVNYVKEMSGIDISQMKADERRRLASTFPKDVLVRNVVLENLDWWRALAANPAGMTRFFDGEKEGVIFDFFTRQVRQQMQQEIERENERYQAGKEKIKELGLNSIELNKVIELEDGYTYKKANGEKVKLTVDNGIDVYIYMQNEDAKMKLLHVSGNGLTEKLANRIIDALTPEQKAWGDWMMAELESHRQDSADIMYNVYNSIMGQVDRYFPLVSADRLYGGDDGLDIMSGAEGSTKRYVNKGHTKERVKVIYPLDLNATRTWVTAVKREEHFVAFAKWARDAQYYMDTETPAGIRNVILQKYGPKNIEIFSDYVNSIANAKSYSDNVDKLLSTIIGRGAVSAVAGKLSVMFKQVATLPAVIGKTSFKNFLGSAFAPRVTLENFLKANEILFADYTSARDFVNKKDPIMANRKYGTELIGSLTNMGKKPIDAVASNVSEWIMRHSAGATDAYITKVVWLSCYMTTFENLKKQAQKKGVSFNVEAADKEAVFQASQLISETQNTSLDMDMSYIMRKAKSNPVLKPFVLFSSTPMNLMTNLAYGIPRNIRNKNWKGIAHTIAYVTLAMFGNMAINGAFRRKKDEDDEEFAKRMWIEIGAETVSTLMPGYGGSFASMIRGSFTDTTGDISLISDITRVGRKGIKKVLNPKDNQAGWELFGELLYVGAESFGFPAGAAKNLVKSAYNLNPGYLINKTFAEIFEENFK